jgi:hypothetical protein
MNPTRTRASLAALGLLLGASGAFLACREGSSKESPAMRMMEAPAGEIPAIDRTAPAKLETATFALG